MFAIAWFPSPHSPHDEKPAGNPKMYDDIPGGPYFAEITVLDTAFGRLRKELRKLGIEKNTILWYCSDNGGLRTESSGGRNKKGSIYEGGLRVPSLLEWPSHIPPGTTAFPANTSDIMPTVLAMAGVTRQGKLALDGIDLTPVIEGKTTQREKGIGFWHDFQKGQSTYSDRILKAIMDAQQAGKPTPLPERLRKDIDDYPQFPEDQFQGHAAWLDWPWKLHRIEGKKVTFELYNLVTHPMEDNDQSANPDQAERLKTMKQDLAKWQLSVMRSLNGKDYKK